MNQIKFYSLVFLSLVVLVGGVFLFLNPSFISDLRAKASVDSEVDVEEEEIKTSDAIEEETEEDEEEIVEEKPKIIKSVYATSWTASNSRSMNYLIDLTKRTEINAIVIDIKDYSGLVFYNTNVPEVKRYGAERIRIVDMPGLIDRLHTEGIYVIARVAMFQDPVLARARPDLAIHSKSRVAGLGTLFEIFSPATLWLDNLNLAWVDPASKEVQKYNVDIAKDALAQGFDEINFDYIRFPSDGSLKDMRFPAWDGVTPRHIIIKGFFEYLRRELPDAVLSVDLFGLSTNSYDDLGIGQIIEDAYENFDYVSPMIYPSHYATGFLGYANPAKYPYEVMKNSMDNGLMRKKPYDNLEGRKVYLRPWIQDFDMGAVYDAEMVRLQIQAIKDASGEDYQGFMMWNSSNRYTEGALEYVQ